MNFQDLVKTRQSDRAYLDKPVDRATIDRCIEATRLAPSACNSQPWTFIVIDKPDLRKNVCRAVWLSGRHSPSGRLSPRPDNRSGYIRMRHTL
jgi:nitroreductase